jgi:hypothetical protein
LLHGTGTLVEIAYARQRAVHVGGARLSSFSRLADGDLDDPSA